VYKRQSVGNLVVVDRIASPGKRRHEGGEAYILDNNVDGSGKVQVQFVQKGKLIVSPRRILREKTLDTVSRRRANDKCSWPSLLSIHHQSKRNEGATTEKRSASPVQRPIWQKITASRDWRDGKDPLSRHPILAYLKNGRNKDFGWLRRDEAAARGKVIAGGNKNVHLDPDEKSLLVTLRRCTHNLTTKKNLSSKFSPTQDLAHAFGVSVSTARSCVMNEDLNNGSNKRKERSDAGETLFNSDRKRKQFWTAQHYHAKRLRIVYEGEGMMNEEIKADFDRLTPAELRECEAGAKRMIDQLVSTDASIT
jgi:hypothetical protein